MEVLGKAAMRKSENTETGDPVRRFLARAGSRTAIIYLVVGLLVVVAIIAGGREIEHHIIAIESFIAKLGPLGVLAFVGYCLYRAGKRIGSKKGYNVGRDRASRRK